MFRAVHAKGHPQYEPEKPNDFSHRWQFSLRRPLLTGLVAALHIAAGAGGAAAYSADKFAVCRLDPAGDNFLALRAGPGSGYEMLAKLGLGTFVWDWERRGNWFRVSVGDVNGRTGWVYSKYLCLIEDH